MPFIVVGIFIAAIGALYWVTGFYLLALLVSYPLAVSRNLSLPAVAAMALGITIAFALASYFSTALFVSSYVDGRFVAPPISGNFVQSLVRDTIIYGLMTVGGFFVAKALTKRTEVRWLRSVTALLVGAFAMLLPAAFWAYQVGGTLDWELLQILAVSPPYYADVLSSHYAFIITWEASIIMLVIAIVKAAISPFRH
jgi:hypothetical protein